MSRSRWIRAAAAAGTLAIAIVPVSGSPALARDSARRTAPAGGPSNIAAVGAELANAITGRVLWSRGRHIIRPIASITKVMTALVVIEAGDLDRRITITQAEVNYVISGGASSAGLIAGQNFSASQLLYAMLLPSGADAAYALADAYGPGWPAFVRKMNRLAARLHLAQTHFSNFDGLPWPTSWSDYSTPGNLIHLGEAAMAQVAFRAIVHRKFYYLPASRYHSAYLWRNRNLLLSSYPHVIGIKTGWTPVAGQCLLFEAVRDKKILIGVVLDSSPVNGYAVFIDAARMLNWGFPRSAAVVVPPPMPGGLGG